MALKNSVRKFILWEWENEAVRWNESVCWLPYEPAVGVYLEQKFSTQLPHLSNSSQFPHLSESSQLPHLTTSSDRWHSFSLGDAQQSLSKYEIVFRFDMYAQSEDRC